MKVYLMYKDKDFDIQQKLPFNEQDLIQDLELDTLFNNMALGDKFLYEIAKKAILSSLNEKNDIETILYRQNILKDVLKNAAIIREMYNIPIEIIEKKKEYWYGFFRNDPSGILYNAIKMMQLFVSQLKKLRHIADENYNKFESEGFKALFQMLKKELDDQYFLKIENHLKELEFRKGVLISVELGKGNEGTDYILRQPQIKNRNWVKNIFTQKNPSYIFYIADRDESGARVLSELKDRAVNLVANALAQSADHIENFFEMLRIELAFYVGCLNLYEQLTQIESPISFPIPVSLNERRQSFKGLYDLCLALTKRQKVVSNDLNADNKELFIITGPNQGGKTVFLRSIGLAQLMMQCGMFVSADFFYANTCSGLFTHFKRKEDNKMKSGKLDEELSRMSRIIDNINPNSLILLNESFSSTNEREGSEIARQIISALIENNIKVFFVTHLYEFANTFYYKNNGNYIFLRAERKKDGTRTFKIIEGRPLETSYGEDLYSKIFQKTL